MSRLDELFEGYPKQMSVGQLAEVLGVTTPTAYGWVQKGRIPAYKVAGTWIVLRDEIRDLMAAGSNVPADPPASD